MWFGAEDGRTPAVTAGEPAQAERGQQEEDEGLGQPQPLESLHVGPGPPWPQVTGAGLCGPQHCLFFFSLCFCLTPG